MSAIETWNRLAQAWILWAGTAALMSALMLALVSVLWWMLRRRASAHLGHLLFLVPLLPLALPSLGTIVLRLPAEAPGVALLAPSPAVERPAGRTAPVATGVDREAIGMEPSQPSLATGSAADLQASLRGPGGARPTPAAWLLLVWLLVAATLLTRFVVVQIATHRHVRAATPLQGEQGERVRAALEKLRARSGVHRTVALALSDAVGSPAVWGLRRPLIVLPPGLTERLDERQLEWMLGHELAHVARHDLLIAALQRVVQIVWFFHPGVWLAGRAAEELRECACDEAALARLPASPRRRCAEALLEVVAGRLPRPTPRLALQTLHDETTLMKKRILRLIDSRRNARSGLSPAAVPGLLVLAGVSLASVRVAQEPTPTPRAVPEEIEAVFEETSYSLDDARAARDRALAWLLAQQHEDGHWPTGPATEVDTGEFNVVGVTALAVLALHEEQQRVEEPARAAAIERALGWLARVQDPETNLFGPLRGIRVMASHAVATQAWLKTRAGRPEEAWRPQAERAVAAILRAHNPYRGWRFSHRPDGDNDSFSTSLMLSALAEAERAGLEVPPGVVEAGLQFLEDMTEPANGRTGYNDRGSLAPRLADKGEDFPAEHSEMCTAIAILARLEWGQEPRRSEPIRDGAHLISSSEPRWDPVRGSTDFYYWLFGSQALARLGGYPLEHWREALLQALLPHQQPGGWWPAVDAWSDEGTTVHATLVNTLALQAVLQ